jgi:hypothetical protein
MGYRQIAPWAVGAILVSLCIDVPALAVIRTYSHTFAAGELTIERIGGQSQQFVRDQTTANFNLTAAAASGDEIHINLSMASGLALKFLSGADQYVLEAYLWNDGGVVHQQIDGSQFTFGGGSNVNNLSGGLNYEDGVPSGPSWDAFRFATTADLFGDPSQPGQFTRINTTFTVPSGYALSNFSQVYVYLSAEKLLFNHQPPPAAQFLQVVSVPIPEPAPASLVCVTLFTLATAASRLRRRPVKL